jgi:hypothetical protein
MWDLGQRSNDASGLLFEHTVHEHTQRPIQIPAPPAGG